MSWKLNWNDDTAETRLEFETIGIAALPKAVARPTTVSKSGASTPSPASSPKTASAAPSWISGLGDAALKADMTAIAASGTCTETQMEGVFADLVTELKNANAVLSSGQFSDLKTIASEIGTLGASTYVQYITNALVNGNVDNATWTGGKSAVKLGNLAVGSSATILSELNGKWFLGADNPAATVSMSGAANFNVTYTATALPLYAAGAPSINDINQGYLGDCYLLSSLGEVASQDPSLIESMIANNGDNTYGVRFFFGGKAYYVTVDNTLPDGGQVFNNASDLWASLIEKAFAEWAGDEAITGATPYSNSFTKIGNGGDPAYALEAITGASTLTDFGAYGSQWLEYSLNSSLNWTGAESLNSTAAALSQIAADLAVGNDVVLASYTNATGSNAKTTLVADHAMSIYGYDASTGMLEIRNPWGTEPGQYWNTTFEVSLNTLLADGDWISADNAGTASSVSGTSVVAAAGLQAMSQVTSFSVTDSVVNVAAGLGALKAETKLSSLTVDGTSGADAINLTGLGVTTTINLGTNADSATLTGLAAARNGVDSASAINLGSTSSYDMATLGAGKTTIDYALGSGVLDVANFSSAHDLLSINLGGASLLQTIVGGGDWISSATDTKHGVLLAGVTSVQAVTISGSLATLA
jgi:hypothetical protein